MTRSGDLEIRGIEEIEPLDVEGSAIYRGRDTIHNRHVAIKVLDPLQEPLVPRRFDLRRKALTRFADEPGVVSVYATGVTPSGLHYLVMPYFRIGSLADQLAYGPVPWHRAAELICKAADIVGRGHQFGVALGDLKPSSLLLADASSPLVAVYGMATRRFDNGMPNYAAPEAFRGSGPTPSADVYSLALSLAALIAGRTPNRGRPSLEFMSEVEALAPGRIVEVIEHGLSESPANRFGSGTHFANALTAAIEGEPVSGAPIVVETEAEPLDWETLLAALPASDPPPAPAPPPILDPDPTATDDPAPDHSGTAPHHNGSGGGASGGSNGSGARGTQGDRFDDHTNGWRAPAAVPALAGVSAVAADVEARLHDGTDGARHIDDGDGEFSQPGAAVSTDQVETALTVPHTDPDELEIDLTDLAADGTPALDLRPERPGWEVPETTTTPAPPQQPAPPTLPIAAAEDAGNGILADHESIPFRSFDRQHQLAGPENPILRFLDGLQGAWFNRRRSYGSFLAVISLAIIAGVVGWLLIRDLRTPRTPIIPSSSFTTFVDGSDVGAARPTTDMPMLIEPPSTNSTTTTRPRPRPTSATTTATTAPTPEAPSTTAPATAAPTTPATLPTSAAQRPTVIITRPTTIRPTITRPPRPTVSTTMLPTIPSPPSTDEPPITDDPEGLSIPLIERAEVTRVRATSARVGVTSPSCVSTVFSYAAINSRPEQISSSTCSTAHTLLLGVVTPSLRAGTSYTVTVTVTDAQGRTASQTLAFTTLG